MKKVSIRNSKSPKEVKPRVFDAIIDEGNVMLEVKQSDRHIEVIDLRDVLSQIYAAQAEPLHIR